MAVIRRFNKPQGLKDIDVLIEDDAPISIYFNIAEVPDVISQGRSSFLIGGSNLLKPEVEIKLEIINDDSGAVIYTEPVPNYLEGTSRRVSIEVYDAEELFGDATLSVVGELNPNQFDIPNEFRDVYNVRYTRKIYISGAGTNTQPIFFYNQPRMVVGEIVQPYITTTIPTSSVETTTGLIDGDPLEGTKGQATNTKTKEPPGDVFKSVKKSYSAKVFGGGGKNAFINKSGRKVKKSSPEPDKFTIKGKDGATFDTRMVGGKLTINNPQVKDFELESYHEVPTKFESEITDVKNDTTLVPKDTFTIIDTRFDEDHPEREVIVPLDVTAYTASFTPAPTQSISTVNFRSFADIRISRLRTFSGDVYRLKLYARNKDAFGDFELISDQQIESPELLVNPFSVDGNQRVGYFIDQSTINTYWQSGSNTSALENNQYVIDSVEVSGSNMGYSDFMLFQTTGSAPITFEKDVEYQVSFRVLGQKTDKFNQLGNREKLGRMGIFLSGSAFERNHELGNRFTNANNELGFQLTPGSTNKPAFLNIVEDGLVDFEIVEETFSPIRTGTATLQFAIFGGEWYISDVSIKPSSETGFSPDFIHVFAPVPPLTQERPDDYEFIAEFYDVNNNVADTMAHVSASTFQGANTYILGEDNVLSGSMVIGSAIGAGIEMAGVGSGFIRSIGYKGFTSASAYPSQGPGFFMFSGSVLQDITDDYSQGGVGLELVGHSGSYFRFRTDPAELDIRTDAFFIGNENIQFISGSDANIEISSSLFHLDPKNDLLTIGADAIINADLSVNNIFSPAGSNITNAKAAITSQGFAKFVSASIGAFKLNEDSLFSGPNENPNFFISGSATGTDYFISSSNFQVRASGEVSASSLKLSGGDVGGLNVSDGVVSVGEILKFKDSGQITGSAVIFGNKSTSQYMQFIDGTLTVRGDITVDSITTPATIAGAPSTVANASASITADGLATFKSGSIAGWKIFGDILSGSNASLDAAGAALYKSDQGPGSDTSAAFDQLRDEYYIDFTPEGAGSSNYYIKMGPNFGVDKDGILFASGAAFEGAITASKGLIGGFTIGTSSLFSTNIFISGSPEAGGNDDPKYMFISTSNFNVKENGDVTGSSVLFSGGKIAGFDFNSSYISKAISGSAAYSDFTRVYMSSVNDNTQNITEGFSVYRKDEDIDDGAVKVVRLGGLSDTTNLHANNDYGLQVIKKDSNNNYSNILFIGSGSQNISGWNLTTSGFHDDAGSIQISSTHASMSLGTSQEVVIRGNSNSPYIALQPGVALVDKNYGESGIFLGVQTGATPKFSVVGTGGHVKFDGTTLDISTDTAVISGSSITLATPKFFLGDGSNFVSGSDGNLRIFSTGDTTLSGSLINLSTPNMFFGATGSAYVSASGGKMEISSSNFFLDADGDVTMQGTITAVAGDIGGFGISSNSISSSNGNLILSSSGQITGSEVLFTGGKIAGWTINTGNLASSGDAGIRLNANGDNAEISVNSHTFGNNGIQLGYNGGAPRFYVGDGSDNFIKFTTSNGVDIKTLKLEVDANDIEISSTNASMSIGETSDGGKAITLDGSTGKILVGSQASKRVEIFGNHAKGYIATGKSSVGDTTEGFWLANNNANPEFHVGTATNFIKLASEVLDIKVQKANISGSEIILKSPDFFLGDTNNFISGSGGNLKIFSTGDTTLSGSSINLSTPNMFLGATGSAYISASGGNMEISASGFFVDASGNTTMQGTVTATAGEIGGFTIDSDEIKSGTNIGMNSATKAFTINDTTFGNTGIQLQYNSGTPRAFIGKQTGGFVKFDGTNVEVSSSKFLLGDIGTAFVSGSDSKIEISSSAFHLTNTGNITASNIILGDKAEGDFLQFVNGTLTVQGEVTANEIRTPALINGTTSTTANASSSISSDGLATFKSASIAGWDINSTEIKKGTDISLDSSNKRITINDSTFGNEGIQLDYNGGAPRFYVGDGANDFIKYDNNGVNIKTGIFVLDTAKLDIDSSAANGGKIALGSTPPTAYNNGNGFFVNGIGQLLVGSSTGSRVQFDGTNLILSSSVFLLGDSGSAYISGSNSNLEISSSNFFLASDGTLNMGAGDFTIDTSGNVTMAGSVTATAGTIGGFHIGSNALWGGNADINNAATQIVLGDIGDGSTPVFKLGASANSISLAAGTGLYVDGDGDFKVGSTTKYLKYTVSGDALEVKAGTLEIDATDLEISSTQKSMSLGHDAGAGSIELIGGSTSQILMGTGNGQITMSANASDAFIQFGDKTNFGQTTTHGAILGSDNGEIKFDLTSGSNNDNYFRFDGSDGGGIDIKTTDFVLDTTNLDINSSTARIEVSDGSATRVRIGEVDSTAASHYGIVVFDGTGTAASDEIVHLSDAKYQIASWSLSPTQITSENLVIDSAGILQTSDFASGVKGWRISSANNGEAEFEKVTIRGTLSTTVFEKESVNAVGGQLYVANSTIITSSTQISATERTMSVANVGGFTGSYEGNGEILSLKKITDTGFSTEYVLVQSASRDEPSSDKNFAGKLFVVRGYSGSAPQDTGSLGDGASSATTYENGQVIVSTGRPGTGYIRINANPNDTTTPYIDIVERTGSAIYDISLKARLGDLSGLSSGLLYGETNPGFGLFTENVFLQGGITATTGSITGILHIDTDANNKMKLGTNVKNSLDGIYVNDNNFWFTDGDFRAGDSNNFIHASGSTITLKSDELGVSTSTFVISSSLNSGTVKMGSSVSNITDTNNTGIYMDGTGKFRVGEDQSSGDNFIYFNGTTIQMKSTNFDLTAGGTLLINSSTPKIALGSSVTAQSLTVGTGIFMNGSGHFKAGKAGGGRLEWDGTDLFISSSDFFMGGSENFVSGSNGSITISGSNVDIATPTFFMGTTGSAYISGSNSQLEISSSNFFLKDDGALNIGAGNLQVDTSGNVTMEGTVTATAGSIGGFTIDDDEIKSGTTLILDSDTNNGQIKLGAATALNTGNGIYMDGDGNFRVGNATGYSLRFDSQTLRVSSSDFYFGDDSNFISGSGGAINIEADTFDLNTTNLKMSSSFGGTVALGSTPPTSATSGTGTFLSGSGDLLVGSSGGNRIQYIASSGTINLVSNTFGLDATSIVIDSATNNGKIALGGSPPTSATSNNTGSYLDGEGNVLFRQSATDYFKFSGGAIEAVTKKFFLGNSTSAFVSGSDDKIEISSSAFHLQNDGQFLFGNKGQSQYVEWDGSDLVVRGDLAVDQLILPATIAGATSTVANASSSITSTGLLTTVSASIGGWVVGSSTITGGVVTLNSAGSIEVGSLADATTTATTNSGFFADSSGNVLIKGNTNDNDYVKISGGGGIDIKSQTFDLNTSTLRVSSSLGGTIAMGSTVPKDLSSNGIMLSGSGDFNLQGDSNNFLRRVGTDLTIKAETFDLDSTTIVMNSAANSGKIALGNTPPTSVAYTANAGFYVDGTGDFLVRADDDNFIKVYSNTLQLKTEVFDLDAGQLIMDSATNSGKIALGATPPTSITTNAGFYADGTGKVLIGDADGSRISFDGTNFIVSSSQFLMGDSGSAYISGSNSNLEISSSNFFLKSTGDVTMTGNITATTGEIGGFTIDSDEIKSGTNISLNSTNKALTINSSTFGNDGIQLEYNSGDPRFYVGDGSNEFLKFDGSSLDIRTKQAFISGSSITLKSPDFFLGDSSNFISGSGGNLKIFSTGDTTLSGSSINLSTPNMFLGATGSAYVSASGGKMEISSSGFFVDADGNATMQGTVTATAGAIGGFEVTTTQINDTDNDLILKSSGQITGSNVLFDGGKVGGWSITANQLSANNIKINAASGYIEAGDLNNVSDIGDTSVGFFANKDGEVLIKAGTSANKNYMQFKDGTLDINSDKVHMSGSQITLSTPNMFLGATGSAYISASGGNMEISASGFFVDADGNTTMQGTVTATTGEIGGFDITSTTIAGGAVTMSSAGTIKVGSLANATATNNTNSGFFADNSGNVLIKGNVSDDDYIKVSGGGGIDIKTNDFDLNAGSGKLVIESATPSIALTHADATLSVGTITSDSDTSGAGVFMDGGGHFRVIGDANNQIIVDGGSMTLKSDTFTLDAGELFISDADNDGEIGLGSDGSAMSMTAGTGFYANGGGNFRVGKENGEGVSFDGTSLVMSASAFLMGSSGSAPHNGSFISGSNANIEVSSSNFHLKPDGDVVMTGQVTATSGEIGGFLISQNEISSSATAKRGLVLKPGDAIRGYGSSAHSTTGTGGKFSFGAGQSIAPAAGASQPTFDPGIEMNIPGNEAD